MDILPHRFVMYKIRSLYYDMKQQKKGQEKFTFHIKHIRFEVIFLIDRQPFELLIGAIGYSDIAFVLQMEKGFSVSTIPDDQFRKIRAILNLQPAKERFTSFSFLGDLDSAAPKKCTISRVQPHEIAKYKRKDALDADKIYFVGWNNHIEDKRKAHNFEKTEEYFGRDVAAFCRKNNISSMWTDQRTKIKPISYPLGYFGDPTF